MEWNTSFTYIFRTHSEHFFFPYFFVKYWTCFVQSLAPVLTVSLSVSQIGCGLSVRELSVSGSCTIFFFQASTYFKAKQLQPVTNYLRKILVVWHSKKEWQMCLMILNPFTLYIWDTFQYSLINSLSLVSLHPMAHTHENTSISFTLLLFKSVLNIASKSNYISSSSSPCSWCSPLHQALSATAGQIHTRRQHLQLSRGLARCHQDEPVQRQLPQLRLYLPAAGGTNDLRVSSTACVQMTGFQTNVAFDGHTFIKWLSVMYF